MAQAIGGILAMAVGVAVCPIPIVAVVILLTTPRARADASAFVLGWVAALVAVGSVVFVLADAGTASSDGAPSTGTSWLKAALGVALLALAARTFRSRPTHGEEPPVPGWMTGVAAFGPAKSFGLGAALAAVNPKNLLLTVAGAAAIAGTGLPAGREVLAYGVFVVIASVGVAVPLGVYLAMGDRAAGRLHEVQRWMQRNNAVILSVLCLVIGAKLIGDAIGGF